MSEHYDDEDLDVTIDADAAPVPEAHRVQWYPPHDPRHVPVKGIVVHPAHHTLMTANGPREINPGDWVITAPDGTRSVVPAMKALPAPWPTVNLPALAGEVVHVNPLLVPPAIEP